jgi:hypothetical protein
MTPDNLKHGYIFYHMLGDLIYEAEGKLINMRIISVEEGKPKKEVNIS